LGWESLTQPSSEASSSESPTRSTSGSPSVIVRRAAISFLLVFLGTPVALALLVVGGIVPSWAFFAVFEVYVVAIAGACLLAIPFVLARGIRDW
jgi:hypothetical protein